MCIKKDLLDFIVCPACKGQLKEDKDRLLCLSCSIEYKVESGVPILIVEGK